MSVALQERSATRWASSTPQSNDIFRRALGSGFSGNCATDAPKRKNIARFLSDCEAPARAELARRERGRPGGPWEHAGDAAMRAVRSAAVADGGAR